MVDVIINVYGKPWQTLCTLKSLLKHSSRHIDKIYFIEEKSQPNDESISWILGYFNNIVHYTPNKHIFMPNKKSVTNYQNIENRSLFRYQYGIEKSDKKYVFITHNDILYKNDIIGQMLSELSGSDFVGIGEIGQCWNCPLKKADLCDSSKFSKNDLSYYSIMQALLRFHPSRGKNFFKKLNLLKPFPLPECRLNEFACIIDREISIKECPPYSNTPFFGSYDGLDLGDAWFRSLFQKGYKFKNFDINRCSEHMFFAQDAGYQVQLNEEKYRSAEENAKQYFYENFIQSDLKE